MSEYSKMTKDQLSAELNAVKEKYNEFKAMGLKLDMSRGKPSKQQLDLSMDMLKPIDYVENGVDMRNYGILDGIPSCKQLFAELMGVDAKNIIIGPSASLTLMYDYIAQCVTEGVLGSTPWFKLDEVKFLCPVPGYDRHFTILEHFGIKMINVPMNSDGPDVDFIKEQIKDDSVKGMFCVPKYSNPQGITYSDSVVEAIASLKPAAKDFRVIWDNAYIVHDFLENPDKVLNIFEACKEFGTEDYFVEFTSTSKISFPGAGVSCLAASDKNIQMIKKRFNSQMIGHDKLNQLRHAKYFKNLDGIKAHMKKHAALIEPKFNVVIDTFEKELAGTGLASWTKPNGGYFISLDTQQCSAMRVGELCKSLGVVLTSVGATYPYGKDPEDKNIRIAPTFPSVTDIGKAAEVLCLCIKLATIEKMM